jgi:energy-coupling factor transporter ATP-binding protein EcfA2
MSSPKLLEVHITEYKNLRNIRLPWAEGMVLIGANGSGKTNLLECLAWLFADPLSLALALPGAEAPKPASLRFDLRGDRSYMPLPPPVLRHEGADTPEEPFDEWDPKDRRVHLESEWWGPWLDLPTPTLGESLASAGVPDRLREFLLAHFEQPVIRYELIELRRVMEWKDPAFAEDEHDWPGFVHRRFTRHLMIEDPPAWIWDLQDLPAWFDSLKDPKLRKRKNKHVPLLALPDAVDCPVTLQWISEPHAADGLDIRWTQVQQSALLGVERWTKLLMNLPWTNTPGDDSDPSALAREWLSVASREMADAEHEILLRPAFADRWPLGRDGGRLSAGEQRWANETYATTVRELKRFGQQCFWWSITGQYFSDEWSEPARTSIPDDVLKRLAHTGWTIDILREISNHVERLLEGRVRGLRNAVNSCDEKIALAWEGTDLRWNLVLRVIDEPEAHLHPLAQRLVANGLARLVNEGQNVIIASHSPYFIDIPDWEKFHIRWAGDESRFSRFGSGEIGAQSLIARDLGLTSGELLHWVACVLLVEGAHDELILREFFGPELRAAGIATLCMRGTDNLPAAAALDFIEQFLNVPIAVMTDTTRKISSGGSPESASVDKFLASVARARDVQLSRPDIVAYLNFAAAVGTGPLPSAPSWDAVVKGFRAERSPGPFKDWLYRTHQIDLRRTEQIRRVVERMRNQDQPPEPELTRSIRELIAHTANPFVDNPKGG